MENRNPNQNVETGNHSENKVEETSSDKLEIKVRRVRVTTNSKAGAAEFDGRTW